MEDYDGIEWKTKVCQKWLEMKCLLDDKDCTDCHSTIPFRRKPVLIADSFNYLPVSCKYMSNLEKCPKNIECRFSHNVFEVIYHPSKFKTIMCEFCTNVDGICVKYGRLCSKAHGIEELREPLFEGRRNLATACTEEEQNYYLHKYKTKKCSGYPYNCKCNGFDYHAENEKRRSPFLILYNAFLCPIPQCSSENCPFSHSRNEIMYHTIFYKTVMCCRYENHGICKFDKDCSHAHSKTELRIIFKKKKKKSKELYQ